jgi:60S ribosomal subunit assembly/export protein LOC1
MKNKNAAPKRSKEDGVVKRKKAPTGTPFSKEVTGSGVKGLQKRGKGQGNNINKKKKKTYTEAELGIPKLNGIIPVGAVKPKGQKKGKVFVDDPVSCSSHPYCGNGRRICLPRLCHRRRQLRDTPCHSN